jgi:hypothetical protein
MGRYGSGDAQTGVTGADDGPVSELEDGDPIKLGQKKVGELLVFFLGCRFVSPDWGFGLTSCSPVYELRNSK